MLSHDMQGARDANAYDLEQARARASAAIVASANRLFAQNSAAAVPITTVGVVAVLATLTPKVSGRFKIVATYQTQTDGGAVHTVTPELGQKLHTAGAYTNIKTLQADTIPAAGGIPTGPGTIQGIVSGLTLGSSYDFALILTADANGHLTTPLFGATIDVQELPA